MAFHLATPMGTIRPSIGGLLSSSPAHTPREKQLEELSRRERIEIFRFQLWRLLDEPSSSLVARIYSVFMLIVIAVSIINFCISTYPEDLRHDEAGGSGGVVRPAEEEDGGEAGGTGDWRRETGGP